MSLKIFTDGGCIGNPGPGGWGAILLRGGIYEEFGGHEPDTTNNRMEMTAAIEGLKQLTDGEGVTLVTDSRYLIDGATKWIHGWKKRGWKKSDGDPVLNRDLWELVDHETSRVKVKWEHIRGHTGHPENERCDDIANSNARGNGVELKKGDGKWIFDGAKVEKKKSPGKKKSKAPKVPDEPYEKPIYMSLVGGTIAEHASWGECEARIKGVKGSKCKKVKSRNEHIETIVSWGKDK